MSRKTLSVLVTFLAFGTLGAGIPGCPNQTELKSQVDSLQQLNNELAKRLQALTKDLQSLNSDMNQVKQVLPQMTNVLQAQKAKLDELDAAFKGKSASSAGRPMPGKRR